MIRLLRSVGPAILLAAGLIGCASTGYLQDRYGRSGAVNVKLSCYFDTYEVYDRPDAGALLVVTNGVNEAIPVVCSEGAASLPQEERMRRVARIYLDEPTLRPQCAITRETEITPLHREFDYRCPVPAPPVPAKAPAKPTLR